MLDTILNTEQQDLLRDERDLLTEVAAVLERNDVAAEERGALTDSLRQLDELFLLVVVGEFNAGKSALINALLGRELLTEGVTPTTAKIHVLSWGETEERVVIMRHALKNAMIPVLTIMGLQLSFLAGGTIIMEQIFVLPGMGKYLFEAISWRDYPVIQGVGLFISLFLMSVNLAVDLLYGVLDPKIQY